MTFIFVPLVAVFSDLDVVAFEPVDLELAAAEFVAEADAGPLHLQAPDASVAVVFGDHDGNLQVFLERGHELGRVHQSRLVIGQLSAAFLERLTHAADVAVAKDAEHRRD
jgi:hypothetical protein